MSDVQSYDSAVADNAVGGLASTAAHLEASLADLGGYVNSVSANWDGDEQVLYRGVQTRWDNAAAALREVLGQVKQALGNNTTSVDAMRARVRSRLQG